MLSFDKFHFSSRNSLISVAKANEKLILHSLHNGGMVPLMELEYSDYDNFIIGSNGNI